MKFLKVGRVAIITHGRYAGKKHCASKEVRDILNVDAETRVFGQGMKIRTSYEDDCDRMSDKKEEEQRPNGQTLSKRDVVIIQPVDSGNKAHPFGHALVAGIERYPSKITRRMSKTRQEKRNKIKPFVKLVNYNHLMPTRYTLELEGLKGVVSNDTFKEVTQREDAKKTVKKVLEERYTSGKNRWFFTPLRF
ncbi:60S ribosomal protein L27-A [Colletotrichum spaethianum]|uniref:60S ribosomal protein L27 n=1 Tax=Colletotrichum spaethianum TaxID=700344 RepID=A0AA37UKE0_9PEZI|nr:60S ribosomal protein L27-A [Colletotrichum spaethianum]GKT49876.1 60S ribosomal protein L27-A [Colletotrichum spaethianum]